MKKLWNYALVFALLAAFSFSLFGCDGNVGQDDTNYKKELAEHIAREAELEAERDQKESELNRLKAEIEARIDELSARIEALENELEEEQAKDKQYTYTFEEAYESGKITRSDLMHFAYYRYGLVYLSDPQRPGERKEIEFTPTEEQGEMDTVTAQRIELAYLLENYEKHVDIVAPPREMGIVLTLEELTVENWFLTENGYYMVILKMAGGFPSVAFDKTVDDIMFSYDYSLIFIVVKL